MCGLSLNEQPSSDTVKHAGDVALRIIASVPNVGGMYRLDQLIATFAQRSIWLADAYFVGTTSYVQALCAAARSGVDVRLLLPGTNDIPVIRALSRAGLRPLLESGVRVFEWNGSMMHAKTAVVDSCWARVGSTNLNLASWLNNRELDVIVEDERFAKLMEQSYLDDLWGSTEIVLQKRQPRPRTKNMERSRIEEDHTGGQRDAYCRRGYASGPRRRRRHWQSKRTWPRRNRHHALGIGCVAGDCRHRCLLATSLAFPAAVICVWFALSLLVRSVHLRSMALLPGSGNICGEYRRAQITEGTKTGIIIIRTVAIESASFLFAGLNAMAGGVSFLCSMGAPQVTSTMRGVNQDRSSPVDRAPVFSRQGICPDRQAIVSASNHETDCSQAQPD